MSRTRSWTRAWTRVWTRALGLVAPLAYLGYVGCGGESVEREPRTLVVISIDTLRADHLGSYGGERASTPFLDRFAEESIRLGHLTAAAPTTLASHLSLVTGTHGLHHGISRNAYIVHQDNLTLAEICAEAGYRTAGVVSSFALSALTDFNQGFEYFDEAFDDRVRPTDPMPNHRRAASTTDAALGALDEYGEDEDLFLFVHYFDPHHPYDPPAPFDERLQGLAAELEGGKDDMDRAVEERQLAHLGKAPGLTRVLTHGLPRDFVIEADGIPRGIDEALASRYAREVEYLDQEVGRLLAGLEEAGRYGDALIVVTADHGETFWEHADAWNHGLCVYDTTMHVPFLMKRPGGVGAGRTIPNPISQVDVLPTLLPLLDLETPKSVRGTAFLDALDGEPFEDRPVFAVASQPARAEAMARDLESNWAAVGKSRSVRLGRYKYIHTPYLRLSELYDLEADPGERTNLLIGATDEIRAIESDLRSRLDAWAGTANPLPALFGGERLRKQLKDIGYTDGPGESPEGGGDGSGD